MKLTIIRLTSFSEQDHIDLAKIWPEYSPASLHIDDTPSLRRAIPGGRGDAR